MAPDELHKLMHRFRVSSDKLGKAIGVHPVTVRRWRSGARRPGRRDADRMIAFFRELGGEPMPTIDPAEIVPLRTEHRITIEPRDDPLPSANSVAIIEAVSGLIALLAARRGADPLTRPAPAPTVRPQPLSG